MSPADPVVVEVVRGSLVESRHHGRLVVLAPDGALVLARGDADAPMYPRSSLKPLQAKAMLDVGWSPVDDAQVAIAAASHSGSPLHVELVRRVLVDAGLDVSSLDNVADVPLDAEVARRFVRDGGEPDRLHQNCSGKHAAMLATCVAAGWPTTGYRDPEHPLQVAVRRTVEELCGEPVAAVAVDGCGAPLFAVSLVGLARSFSRIATTRVGAAMRAHPDVVGGDGRDVTEVMRRVPGLVAKDGAEGVYAAATTDGGAVALKIDDGASRARLPLLLHGLGALGVDVAPLRDLVPPVLGHGVPAGHLRVSSA